MSAEILTQLAVLIVIAAALYSSVGHAGASGYLAAMALLDVAPPVMRPTALCLNVCVAAIASYQFHRAGYFSWRVFWPFALASVPAAFLGGLVEASGKHYRPLVGVVLLASAARMLLPVPLRAQRSEAPPVPVALAAGAGLGLLAGLTGTGGGIFLSPLLLFMGWGDTKQVAGVSAVFILVNSLAGLGGLAAHWQPLPSAVWLLAVAAILGGSVGSYYGSRHFASTTLRRLLALVLVVAGAKLLAT